MRKLVADIDQYVLRASKAYWTNKAWVAYDVVIRLWPRWHPLADPLNSGFPPAFPLYPTTTLITLLVSTITLYFPHLWSTFPSSLPSSRPSSTSKLIPLASLCFHLPPGPRPAPIFCHLISHSTFHPTQTSTHLSIWIPVSFPILILAWSSLTMDNH